MMQLYRYLLLGLLLLSLGGCTYIATISGNLDQQLDQWMAEEEYGKALTALGYIKADRPDYRRLMERRELIQRQSQQYEKRIVSQADEHLRAGKWNEAQQSYERALDKLPESKALAGGYAALKQLQAQRLAELETELLVARGNSLLELLPVHARRAEINPRDRELQRQLNSAREEAATVARELTRRGTAALERNDIPTAQRTLPLALRLHPASDTKHANLTLLQRLGAQQATNSKPATAKPSRDENKPELLLQYRQAYSRGDLQEARRIVAILELQPTPPLELAQFRRELDSAITAAVRQHLDKGISLYSHGEYEKALSSWHTARELDPENERVNAHIERVERVLSKLQTLQHKQGSN